MMKGNQHVSLIFLVRQVLLKRRRVSWSRLLLKLSLTASGPHSIEALRHTTLELKHGPQTSWIPEPKVHVCQFR